MLSAARYPIRAVAVRSQAAVFLSAQKAGRLCLTSCRAAAVCGFAAYSVAARMCALMPMVCVVRCPSHAEKVSRFADNRAFLGYLHYTCAVVEIFIAFRTVPILFIAVLGAGGCFCLGMCDAVSRSLNNRIGYFGCTALSCEIFIAV